MKSDDFRSVVFKLRTQRGKKSVHAKSARRMRRGKSGDDDNNAQCREGMRPSSLSLSFVKASIELNCRFEVSTSWIEREETEAEARESERESSSLALALSLLDDAILNLGTYYVPQLNQQ